MKKIDIVNKTIVDNQLDGIMLSSDDNRFWFMNFESSAGFLFINKKNKTIFLVDGRYFEKACISLKDKIDEVRLLTSDKPLNQQMSEIFNELDMKNIGIEAEYTNLNQYNSYLKMIDFKFTPFNSVVLRAIKEDYEIDLLKKAADIAAETIEWIKTQIKPGMTEIEVANMISKHMLDLGASKNSFDPIVASGVNGSFPHHKPGNKVIEMGDMITVDIGCIYKGYCSDITRSFILGDKANNPEMIEIYNVVLESQLTGIEKATNNINGLDLDLVCRNIISNTKYANYFSHSTGHGVGIQVHEEPYVSSRNKNIFKNNSVITIEPGIYVPETGGVRIEDTIVIRDNKAIVLTRKANKDLYTKVN